MDTLMREKVRSLLDEHRDMSLAAIRSDGWPQATFGHTDLVTI